MKTWTLHRWSGGSPARFLRTSRATWRWWNGCLRTTCLVCWSTSWNRPQSNWRTAFHVSVSVVSTPRSSSLHHSRWLSRRVWGFVSRCSNVDGALECRPARQRPEDRTKRSRSRAGHYFSDHRKPPAGTERDHHQHQVRSEGVIMNGQCSVDAPPAAVSAFSMCVCAFRYKENVQKLAALHNDRPVDPLDLSVYWTEYVMKHKGAKHLKAAVRDLNWFQYFCLDVITLLAATVLLSVTLTVKCLKFCFGKLNRKKKQA